MTTKTKFIYSKNLTHTHTQKKRLVFVITALILIILSRKIHSMISVYQFNHEYEYGKIHINKVKGNFSNYIIIEKQIKTKKKEKRSTWSF